MKTVNRLFGILLGTTALFLSCTKQENPVHQDGNTFEMTIVAGSDQTRTVLGSDGTVTWSASREQLAVMEVANGTETKTSKAASKEGVTTDEGATMSFGVSMNAKTADSFDYYALYPNSAYVETPSDFTKVKVSLASIQAPTESSFGPSADVLVAKPVTGLTEQPTELNLQFARVIAVGRMTIKDLNTKENVQNVVEPNSGIRYNIYNDRCPQYYTSFNDKEFVCDAFNSKDGHTLMEQYTVVYGYVQPEFKLEDTFVPDLAPQHFSLLLSTAKVQATYELNKTLDALEQSRAMKQKVTADRHAQRVRGQDGTTWKRRKRSGRVI